MSRPIPAFGGGEPAALKLDAFQKVLAAALLAAIALGTLVAMTVLNKRREDTT